MPTEYEHLLFDVRNDVAWVTFNRPEKLNCINLTMRSELFDAIDTIRASSDIRAAVFTGAGRAFCTGADLTSPGGFHVEGEGTRGHTLDHLKSNLRWSWPRLNQLLWEVDKPTVAAVNGWALGFGFHFALYCDFLIASEDARFQFIWGRRGLPVEAAGAYILPRLVGINKAKELILLADPFSPQEAKEMGLATRVVPADELLPHVTEFAERLASGPTRIMGIHKRQIQMSLDSTIERSTYDEINALILTSQSSDAQEARKAFGERREPNYTGQ